MLRFIALFPGRVMITMVLCSFTWLSCSYSDSGAVRTAPLGSATPGYTVRQVSDIPVPAIWKRVINQKTGKRESMEFSGLAWYGDYLVLLPQMNKAVMLKPEEQPCLYAVRKEDILTRIPAAGASLPRESSPLPAFPLQLRLSESLLNQLLALQGYEGFEAVAFRGDDIYIAVECAAGGDKKKMQGYLLSGEIDLRGQMVTLNAPAILKPLNAPSPVENAAFESLLVAPESLILIYEANGVTVNDDPRAYCFQYDLSFLRAIPFPAIPFRVTDVTAMDQQGRFYALNYFYTGDQEKYRIPDEMFERDREQNVLPLERIVAYRLTPEGIITTLGQEWRLEAISDPAGGRTGRNWEGVELLSDGQGRPLGFLIITDQYPDTLMGFVPY